MGIRFKCPQGHKINVKAFLAGKRGFCPTCGASVDIPLVDPSANGPATEASPFAGLDISTAPAKSDALGATVAAPTTAPVVATSPTAATPSATTSAAPALNGAPVYAPLPTAPPAAADPITAAPQAVWYIRPRSGGQYGPATGDMLRQWITEHRVAADSLVWREGWPQWQTASDVFREFTAPSIAVPSPTLPTFDVPDLTFAATSSATNSPTLGSPAPSAPVAAPIDANPSATPYQSYRRRKRMHATLMIVTLAAIAVGLIGVLIWRLMYS